MEINVIDEMKIVEIWLTNQDQKDDLVDEMVKNITKDYSGKKYKVVIFRSGNGDLYDCTESLIKKNRCLEPLER